MHLLFVKQWLGDGLLKAVCWTLLHSLWQGLILAALAGLLVTSTRKVSAVIRYNLLAILFFVFMGVVACTFIRELNAPARATVTVISNQVPASAIAPYLSFPEETESQVYHEKTYIESFTAYFNEHAALLVAIWFLIFLAKTVKLMGGLVYIQRIKHQKIYQPHESWIAKLQQLVQCLGITIPVRLLESELVKVPMVTGLLKPVILLPVGLMANLPVEQVESILLHELAHIRRRDFMVNLAQSFAEVLFFFNPAVLWLSSLLREEREHCCDDMAIAVTNSKTGYIQALVAFQEYHLEKENRYAMAFPGKKNQLLNRVKRILDNSNKTLNMAEKSFLILCFSIMGLLTVVFSQTDKKQIPGKAKTAQQQKDQQKGSKNLAQSVADKSEESSDTRRSGAHTNDQSIYDQLIHDQSNPDQSSPDEPVSDEATIEESVPSCPPSQTFMPMESAQTKPYHAIYKPYESNARYGKDTLPILQRGGGVITGIITHTKDGKVYKITVEKNKAVGLMVDGNKIPDDKLDEYIPVIKSIFREMGGDIKKENDNIRQAEQDKLMQAKVHDQLLIDNKIQLQNANLLKDEKEKIALQEKIALNDEIVLNEKIALQNRVNLKSQVLKTNEPKRTIIDDIIDDLKEAGLIVQVNTLSFQLNRSELIINGQRQPDAVQHKFQEKYIKNPSDRFKYDKAGNETRTEIVREK